MPKSRETCSKLPGFPTTCAWEKSWQKHWRKAGLPDYEVPASEEGDYPYVDQSIEFKSLRIRKVCHVK